MTDLNPATAIMSADCPPESMCRFVIWDCCVARCTNGGPSQSRYHYHCTTCDRHWQVDWPQVQPIYDRAGAPIEIIGPIVTRVA